MRILGIDVGINSLGFSLINTNTYEITTVNSRVFEAAEQPKTGASLAEPRREKRGQRNRITRKSRKQSKLRTILKGHGLPARKQIRLDRDMATPWMLRKDALERVLSPEEFSRVIRHFAKRPGFESNRKSAPDEKSEGPLLSGSSALRDKMKSAGAQTIGAYLATLPKQRNNHKAYNHTVLRDDLRAELRLIFDRQQALGNKFATPDLLDQVLETAFYRRPLQSSLSLVGDCSLEKAEKRAPKHAWHSEIFVALSRLTSLRIVMGDGARRDLSTDEIALLEDKVVTTTKVTFAQARKFLGLDDGDRFNLATYRRIKDGDNTWDAVRSQAEKATLIELKGFHTLRKALLPLSKMDWTALSRQPDKLDDIAFALTFFEEETQIREILIPLDLTEEQIVALLGVTSFSKTIDLSLTVVKKLIPLMRRGRPYGAVVKELYPNYGKKQGTEKCLPPQKESTRNPIVDRAISQARKAINAIIREHGMPDRIHVETARDLGRSFEERRRIERENKKRVAFKEETIKHAAEIYGYEPRGDELAKFRLWKEQGMFCPYSGVYITPQMLKDGTETQIDHILPYSRSFDDSWSNKIVCLASENQHKKNETAWDYMVDRGRESALQAYAEKQENPARREKLLLKNYDEAKEDQWKARHLNDTSYVARALVAYLEENLMPNKGMGKLVHTRKGALTSKLRHLWGLPEKNRDGDHRHHGIDAAVIAAATQSNVQKAARWSRYERPENWYKLDEDRSNFYAEPPWPTFRRDVMTAADTMFVSRQISAKTGGALHKDTIMSARETEDGTVRAVKRVRVEDLKLASLENLVDVEVVDGVPRGRSTALYQVLYDRLTAFDGDGKKAFAEPVHMPLKPGKAGPDGDGLGPQIHRVRLYDNSQSFVRVKQGIADHKSMAWVEVYEKAGKFYLLPIYTIQVAQQTWPDRLILQGKSEKDWDQLDDSFNYLFALRKNEYVVLRDKKDQQLEGYYKGTHRGTGAIKLEDHLGSSKRDYGIKLMKSVRKFHIDVFGRRSEIKETAPWRGVPSS